MNRRALLVAVSALFLTSFPALAYEEARLSPSHFTLNVGETGDVQVSVHHLSGLNYTMWRFRFGLDSEGIVALGGILDYQHPVG